MRSGGWPTHKRPTYAFNIDWVAVCNKESLPPPYYSVLGSQIDVRIPLGRDGFAETYEFAIYTFLTFASFSGQGLTPSLDVVMHSTTSITLLQKVRQPEQHPDAWERFTHIYVPLLYRQARSMGLQPEDASDLVQDVLLILVRSLPDFQYMPGRSFRSWLRTVMRNCWRSRLRKRRHYQAEDVHLEGCAVPDPLDQLSDEEYARHLVHVTLPTLRSFFPPSEWLAFEKYVLEGRPVTEVAHSLGISTATVYAARSKIMRKLREELRELLD